MTWVGREVADCRWLRAEAREEGGRDGCWLKNTQLDEEELKG
jgi:hypothetical protein